MGYQDLMEYSLPPLGEKDGLSNDLIHDLEIFYAHLSKAVKSSDENMVILKEEYDNWRGNIPPIDDVLVIGFQI